MRISADEALRHLIGYIARLRSRLALAAPADIVRDAAGPGGAMLATLERPPETQAAHTWLQPHWPALRVAAVEALWGSGFLAPGGAGELLRLAKPLGLRSDMSLLLLGAGIGGPAASLVKAFGCWVAAYEPDPDLHALGELHAQQPGPLTRRITTEGWSTPFAVRPRYYHQCLSLCALREASPQHLLAVIAGGLRPGGQLALVDVVADQPLDDADPLTAAWCRLEKRAPQIAGERDLTEAMGRAGLDVRVTEDVSDRHVADALAGWRDAVAALEAAPAARPHIMALVLEAELWLYRVRLIRAGRIRLVRWHALKH